MKITVFLLFFCSRWYQGNRQNFGICHIQSIFEWISLRALKHQGIDIYQREGLIIADRFFHTSRTEAGILIKLSGPLNLTNLTAGWASVEEESYRFSLLKIGLICYRCTIDTPNSSKYEDFGRKLIPICVSPNSKMSEKNVLFIFN